MKSALAASCLLLATGVGLALDVDAASAYVRLRTPDGVPLAWQRGCPAFTIVTGGGAQASGAEMASVIEAARAAWQEGPGGCGQLPVEIAELRGGAADVSYDGSNHVLWRDADYCALGTDPDDEVCLSPNAAAVTTLFYYERGERAGELVEADVEVNGAFVFGRAGESDRLDLLATLTHELGHALGLEHACETVPGRAPSLDSAGVRVPFCFPLGALPEPVRAATMFPFVAAGDLGPRTPLDDERAGICDLYRDHAGTCFDTGPGCGCRGGGSGGAFAAAFAALVLLVRSGLRSRR